jgi:hypothetical protein
LHRIEGDLGRRSRTQRRKRKIETIILDGRMALFHGVLNTCIIGILAFSRANTLLSVKYDSSLHSFILKKRN